MKKSIFKSLLVSLLLLILINQTVYSIDISSCGTLSTNNVTYNLINNITSTDNCFIITANNTIFNGNGFTLSNTGDNDHGFQIREVSNLSITNLSITNFYLGEAIYVGYLESFPGGYNTPIAFNISISNINFTGSESPVYIRFGFNVSIFENRFESSSYGVKIAEIPYASRRKTNISIHNNYINNILYYGIQGDSGDGNSIYENTISNSKTGIYLDTSSENIVHSNKISNNSQYGIQFIGATYNNTIYNNLLNNSLNFDESDYTQINYFNITKQTSLNIVNMPSIGGNYFGNPSNNGFSDVCSDDNYDGFCDTSFTDPPNTIIDYLPLTIDSTSPDINTKNTSITTPIYADTINISANVTDATTSVEYCNFTLTDPNSIKVIDNITGTQDGDIWNSTNYKINVSGNWTVNITCADTFNNSVSSQWTFRADLGTITPIPSTKTYSQIAGDDELFNITLSHTGNNNNTIDFNLTGDISNTTNFTITFQEDPATIEESETQYVLVNITSLESLDSGTYTGNITWNRTEDGTSGVIEVEISISAAIGDIVQTPEALEGSSLTTNDIVSRTITLNNTGTRLLENCNLSIDTGLATYTTYNQTSFDLDPNNETQVLMTVHQPAVGVYSTTVTTTCTATAEGGLDTDTSTYLVVVTAPIPAAGGGGGVSTAAVCGNFVCETGETELGCPTDCIARYSLNPMPLTFSMDRLERKQFEVSIINLADRELDLTIKLKPVEGNDTISEYTYLMKGTVGVPELQLKIPKTIGLISGQVFITIETNLGEDVDYGTYEMTLELFDGSTVKSFPVTIVVEQNWWQQALLTFPNGTSIRMIYLVLVMFSVATFIFIRD